MVWHHVAGSRFPMNTCKLLLLGPLLPLLLLQLLMLLLVAAAELLVGDVVWKLPGGWRLLRCSQLRLSIPIETPSGPHIAYM